jgi:hypothetical protein
MGNCIMSENNSEAGIPAKPVKPPVINDGNGGDPAVAVHPGHTKNVASKSRWRPRARKKTVASEQANPTRRQAGSMTDGSVPVRRKIAWYWAVGAAALLLIAGLAAGTTLPDPKNSKEFLALTAEKEGLQSNMKSLQSKYDSLDAGVKGREARVQAREDAVTKADAAVKTADAAVKKREEAVKTAETTQAANTIKEGTWTVGADIQPGTYRAVSDVSSTCYWGIYRSGSNGSDIIDNDIVSGGRPSVTLSVGQDFKTSRCGSWLKQ